MAAKTIKSIISPIIQNFVKMKFTDQSKNRLAKISIFMKITCCKHQHNKCNQFDQILKIVKIQLPKLMTSAYFLVGLKKLPGYF